MESRSRVIFAMALGVAACLALGGVPALADEARTQEAAEVAETVAPAGEIPVSVAGMTVFIDAESGQLRPPTAEEAAALSAAMQSLFSGASLAAPREFALKDGGVAVDVGLSQLDFSVATVGADGVEFNCLDSAHAAEEHVHNQTPTTEEK